SRLTGLAPDREPDVEISGIDAGDDDRPGRTKGVEAFRASPLPVTELEVPCGDVADDRVSEHIVERLRGANATTASPDDDSELSLVVDTDALGGKKNRLPRTDQR